MRSDGKVHALSSIALALLMGLWTGSAAAQQKIRRLEPAATSGKVVIEAEALSSQANANAGAVSVQDMRPFGTGWSGDKQLFWQPPAPQEEPIRNWPSLTVLLSYPGTGRVNLILHHTVASDYGKVRVFVNGAAKVDFNGWNNEVAARRVPIGEVELAGKPIQLVFTVFGKDDASSGYFVGLDSFDLTPITRQAGAAGPAAAGGAEKRASAVALAVGDHAVAVPVLCGESPKGTLCRSVCNGTQALDLMTCGGPGICKLFVTLPCSPYQCRDGTCLASCSSDDDCAASHVCRNGLCLLRAVYCADGPRSGILVTSDQRRYDCTPYACYEGGCLARCGSTADCANGFFCNAGGQCAPPSQ